MGDQFEVADFRLKRCGRKRLCTPSSKNGSPVTDFYTHLKMYRMRRAVHAPEPNFTVTVRNQFGAIRVRTIKAEALMVPSSKSLVPPAPPPPSPGFPGYEHFKCYRVKALDPFTPVYPVVADQFGIRQLQLGKPKRLCTPAVKNGIPIKDETRHLLCYPVKPYSHPPSPVYVDNQFGAQPMNLNGEKEFCVSSTKGFSPSGAFLDRESALF